MLKQKLSNSNTLVWYGMCILCYCYVFALISALCIYSRHTFFSHYSQLYDKHFAVSKHQLSLDYDKTTQSTLSLAPKANNKGTGRSFTGTFQVLLMPIMGRNVLLSNISSDCNFSAALKPFVMSWRSICC